MIKSKYKDQFKIITAPGPKEINEADQYDAIKILDKHGQEGEAVPYLTSEARELLLNHNWPGNVRELRNLVERITILSSNESKEKINQVIDDVLNPSFKIKDNQTAEGLTLIFKNDSFWSRYCNL